MILLKKELRDLYNTPGIVKVVNSRRYGCLNIYITELGR